ncbi:MAG: leucine-rich repeat protein [Lachnospiraceae bacterium]|nr:leucine-rich repeat protein [Lachnospiraceae bacterium]
MADKVIKSIGIRIILMIWVISICVLLYPSNVKSSEVVEDGIIDESLYYTLDSEGILFIQGNGGIIGKEFFKDRRDINEVVFKCTVTEIGDSAFENCTSLKSIKLPEGLKRIGRKSFASCSSLIEVTVPDSVTWIDSAAFEGCNNMESISLPFIGVSQSQTGHQSCFGYIFGFYKRSAGEVDCINCAGVGQNDAPCIYSKKPISSNSYYNYKTNSTAHVAAFRYSIGNTTLSNTNKDYMLFGEPISNGKHSCNPIKPWCKFYSPGNIPSDHDIECLFSDFKHFVPYDSGSGIQIMSNGFPRRFIWADENVGQVEWLLKSRRVGIKAETTIETVGIESDLKKSYYSVYSNAPSGDVVLDKHYELLRRGWLETYYFNIPPSLKTVRFTAESEINGYEFLNLKTVDTIVFDSQPVVNNDAFYGCTANVVYNAENASDEYSTWNSGAITYQYSVISSNEAQITGFSSAETTRILAVPEIMDGYTVTRIGENAFAGTSIERAAIPNTVKAVGAGAFDGCKSLSKITFGSGLEEIGECAFRECAIVQITLPNNLTSIKDNAFYNCVELSSVTFNSKLEHIGNSAFKNTSLSVLSFPESLQTIGNNAFEGSSLLHEVDFKLGIISIGNYAFSKCGNLNSIIIPKKIRNLADGLFYMCTNLEQVTLAGTIETVGEKTFEGCSSLVEFPFGNELTDIGYRAFADCVRLTSISLPQSMINIYPEAFVGCVNLSSLHVFDSLRYVGMNSLSNVGNLTVSVKYKEGHLNNNLLRGQDVIWVVLDSRITSIGDGVFNNCNLLKGISCSVSDLNKGEAFFSDKLSSLGCNVFQAASCIEKIILPDSITSIGEHAFDDSGKVMVEFYYVFGILEERIIQGQSIGRLQIDNGITCIGDSSFADCDLLNDISVPDGLNIIGSDVFDGCNATLTIRYENGLIKKGLFSEKLGSISNLIVESGISIGENAFSGNTCLTDVEIRGAEQVDKRAFSECTGILTTSLNAQMIADSAFAGCSSLNTVILEGTRAIGEKAFYNNSALNNINFGESIKSIGSQAFCGCIELTNVSLPETIEYIGEEAFKDDNALAVINIPEGLEVIPDGIFYNCTSLVRAVIPNNIIKIGKNAFYNCIDMRTVSIGNKVTEIDDCAFWGCEKIRTVIFPDILERIGACAFEGCKMLYDIQLPNKLSYIGFGSFRSCTSLEAVSIPNGVELLESSTFYGCSSLERVDLGVGTIKLGERCFYGCGYLKDVFIEGDIEEILSNCFYSVFDATLYAYDNEYVEQYCDENGLTYYNLAQDFTMEMTAPDKTEYLEGEELDLTGLTLDVTYANGETKSITSGYTVSGYDPVQFGAQLITVTYHGQSKTFTVNVAENHVPGNWAEIIAPGCTTEGEEAIRCIHCGRTLSTRTTDPLGHSFGEWIVYREAAADEAGESRRYCSRCDVYESQVIPKTSHEHSFTGAEEIIREATCTETGEKRIHCAETECVEYISQEIAALGHDYISVVTLPTASSQGYTTHTCSRCGDSYTDNFVDQLPAVDENAPQFVIESKLAKSGEAVDVSILLKNNPGIASVKAKVAFDSDLVLTAVTYGEQLGGTATLPQRLQSPVVLHWYNGFENTDGDVVLATLTFMVSDTAETGEHVITLSYDPDDVYNINEENIEFAIIDGILTVRAYVPGDINGDGKVNNKDLTRLCQHLAEWDVEVNALALDVNGDGKVNNKDLTRLCQYLAEWDVQIY